MTAEQYDVVIVGAGPGGEVAAYRLAPQGMRVALVEQELIGGSCAYWACVPSKTLLRPPGIDHQVAAGYGVRRGGLDWEQAAAYRDFMVRDYDDAKQIEQYAAMGVEVVKAPGRLRGPGVVEAAGRRLLAPHIVLATGSEPSLPPIEGLDGSRCWTSRDVTSLRKPPASIIVAGGGAVAVELSQMLAAYGTHVTMVQRSRLLRREDQAVSDAIAEALQRAGVEVRLGVAVESVARSGDRVRAELSDGSGVDASELLVATGRRPRSAGLGLEAVDVAAGGAVEVDAGGRAGPGLWAVGDVTGVALFTHVAKYMGRTVAANIIAETRGAAAPRALDFSAVPRVVFSHPEVAAVGITEGQARSQGTPVAVATVEMSSLTRPFIYEREPRGMLRLVAHAETGVLLGAAAVAPLAGEFINLAALAVKAGLTASFLRDTIVQYPTFSEAYIAAAEDLAP